MIDIIEIKNKEEFNRFIETKKDDLHFIKFSTEFCGPCKIMDNRIKNLEKEKVGNTLFAEVTIYDDDTEDLAREFSVTSVPVFIYIKGGEVKYRSVGVTSSDELYNRIKELA